MRTRTGGYLEGNRIDEERLIERRRRSALPRLGGGAAVAVTLAVGLVPAVVGSWTPRASAAPAPVIRVLVASGPAASATAPTGGRLADASGDTVFRVPGGEQVVFETRGDSVAASVSGRVFDAPFFDLAPEAAGAGVDGLPGRPPLITVGSASYRGFLRVVPGSAGGGAASAPLLAINVLPAEEYLYGVVSREMPAGWPEEALKAQAVVCRSFALSCVRAASARGASYDVTASSEGQVYEGFGRENPAAVAAVDSTRGMVLTYGGEPIRAVYHSSSGGHTENSECVWSAALPYLRGVPDVEDGSPHSSWEFEVTAAEVERLLRDAGVDVGELKGVSCVDSGVSGRWNRVAVVGSSGRAVVRGLEFRKALGLKSTLFTLSVREARVEDAVVRRDVGEGLYAIGADGRTVAVPPPRPAPEVDVLCCRSVPGLYVFRGRGFGHGVGMSQWGAKALAERGYKYADILKAYYLDTRLEEYAG